IRQLLAAKTDPWLRTITTFALGEMGAAQVPKSNGKLVATDAKSDRRARRPRLSDLVSALDDSDSQPAARPAGPEQPAAPVSGPLTLPEITSLLQNMHADPAPEV